MNRQGPSNYNRIYNELTDEYDNISGATAMNIDQYSNALLACLNSFGLAANSAFLYAQNLVQLSNVDVSKCHLIVNRIYSIFSRIVILSEDAKSLLIAVALGLPNSRLSAQHMQLLTVFSQGEDLKKKSYVMHGKCSSCSKQSRINF